MRLVRSPDPVKDQSYFLCGLSQAQLQRCLFPIGHLQKAEVRVLAAQMDLPTKLRKDSQGVCFLGQMRFEHFLAHYLGERPGEIRCFATEEVLGAHKGLWFHTVGQRKGVGLLLRTGTVHKGPYFVAGKDVARNVLYVTNDLQKVELPRRVFFVQKVNWISGVPPQALQLEGESGMMSLDVKLRHGPNIAKAFVTVRHKSLADHATSDVDDEMLRVELVERDQGIAAGQFAAFYVDDVCLGAGVISEVAPTG